LKEDEWGDRAASTFGTISKQGNKFRVLSAGSKRFHIMSDHYRIETANQGIILELTDRSLPKAEATLIHKVLKEKKWNLKQAARELEIARTTLYSKMKKHNIKRPSL